MAAISRLPLVPTAEATDKLTRRDADDEQTVDAPTLSPSLASGPYRDGADAKLARARNLEAWLARLSEAEAARGALEREHALLEESIRHERASLLGRVRVATPCKERWDEMVGDDAARHCARCRRQVFDLSRMSRTEIEALFAREGEVPCVRLHRRPDGRVVTAECPPPDRLALSPLKTAAVGALAGAAIASGVAAPLLLRVQSDEARLASAERRMSRLEVRHDLHVSDDQAQDQTVAAHLDGLEARMGTLSTQVWRQAATAPPRAVPASDTVMGDAVMGAALIDASPDPRSGRAGPEGEGFDAVSLSSTEFLVSRAALTSRTTDTLTHLRLVPHEQQGVVLGVRVYGVRPGSLPSRLGVRNGDTLVTLNGISLGSTTSFAALSSTLRDSTALELVILRRGRPVRLRYTVVG